MIWFGLGVNSKTKYEVKAKADVVWLSEQHMMMMTMTYRSETFQVVVFRSFAVIFVALYCLIDGLKVV